MFALLLLAACELDGVNCTTDFRASVTVTVASDSALPLENVVGTYTVDGGPEKACEAIADSQFWCGGEEAGHFEITFSADTAEAVTQEVDVEADECHVIGETLDFTLVAEPPVCSGDVRPSVVVQLSSDADGAVLENTWVTWKDHNSATDEAPAACDSADGLEWSCGEEFVGTLDIEAGADGHDTVVQSVTTALTADECHVDTEELNIELAKVSEGACTEEERPAVIVNLTSDTEADAALENQRVTWVDVDTDMLPIDCERGTGDSWSCASGTVGNLRISATADYHHDESRDVTTVLTSDLCHVDTQTLDIEMKFER
jgi:hypothetical protein